MNSFWSRLLAGSSIALLSAASMHCSGAGGGGNSFGAGLDAGVSSDAQPDDAAQSDDAADAISMLDTGFDPDAKLTQDGACAAERVEAEVLPLALYLMVDRSGSMTSGGKWTNQSAALKNFFADPQSDGLFLAMRFFPLNDSCSPTDWQCSGDAYVKPLVDWGLLPGHSPALSAAIDTTGPDGCFTPTQEALNGVLRGALARQVDQPQQVVAAVIVSDGAPCCGDCPQEAAGGLGAIAGQYANGTPSIKTFSIFVESSASPVMSAIAQQGGTGQAFDATGGQQAFIDALKAIRGSMLACEYKMPTTEAGTINPELIQVEYTPGGATEVVDVKQLDSAAQCGDGWYYDDNQNPTKIIMCPSTCSTLQNDEFGQVQILVGCSGTQT